MMTSRRNAGIAPRLRGGFLGLTLFACFALPCGPVTSAKAQVPASGEAVKAAAGTWEISNAERDRSCVVTLRASPNGANAAVDWEAKCAELFPYSRTIVAWRVGARQTIQLLDAKSQIVLELSEVEGGLYEGERMGEGLVFLQSLAGSLAEERKPEQLAGEWAFTGPAGRALCRVTLTATPAPQDALVLRMRPGCDAAISRFGPVAWRFDRGQLVIIPARGDVWRFEESDSTTWQRIPQSRQGMKLVRQ